MKFILLYFFILFQATCFSQEVISTHYTLLDGLSSNAVYSTLQDSKGYLWFGTNAGINRFDGIEWEKFSFEENISGIDIYRIYEDKSGRIWFLCGNGSLCFYSYDSNKIIPVEHNLSEINPGSFLLGFGQYKENLFWGSNSAGIIQLNKNGEIKSHLDNICGRHVSYFFEYEAELYAAAGGCLLKYDPLANEFSNRHPLPAQNYIAATIKKDTFYLAHQNVVIKYNLKTFETIDTIVFPPSTSILYVNHDFDNNLLIGTSNGLYKNNKEWYQLIGNKISDITMDHENGIWISTLNNGVFYLKDNASLLFSNKKNKNLALTNFGIDPQSTLINVGNYRTIDLSKDKYGFQGSVEPVNILFKESINEINNNQQFDHTLVQFDWKLGSARMYQVVDSLMYFSRHSGLYEKRFPNEKNKVNEKCLHKGNVTIFLIDGENKWIGDNLGLWLISNGKSHHITPDVTVTSIKSHSGLIYVTTRGKGLYIFKNNALYAKVGEAEGLSNSFCLNTYEDANGRIWIGTRSGVTIIYKIGNLVKLRRFSTNYGAINGIISDIIITDNNYLWLETPEGIIRRNYQTEISSTPAGIEMKSILINDEKVNPLEVENLDYHENNIRIELSGLTYKSPPQFIYRLVGGNESWSTTENPNINLVNLSSGNYKFEAYSVSAAGIKSKNMLQLAFTIHPPFWQSYWFITIITIALLLIIVLFFKIRVLTYNRDVVRDILLSISRKLSREQFILVKNVKNGAQTKILLEQIIRIKGAKDYIIVVTKNEEIMVKMTMKIALQELNNKESNFYRVHQSHIVNIKHVNAIHGDFATIIEDEIPIGRAFKKNALKMKERLFS